MKKLTDAHLRRDIFKLVCLFLTLMACASIFKVVPAMSTPLFLSIVITLCLSPFVAALERRGHSRALAICILFGIVTALLGGVGVWMTQSVVIEWGSFQKTAPQYFSALVSRLQEMEREAIESYPFLSTVRPTASLIEWGEATGRWFLTHGPRLMGELVSWIFIVPIITFVLLKDGRKIRKKFFELVPNRFFEASFMITMKISASLSEYLRAKLLEGLLVGAMVAIGLAAVGAPYAIVFGLIAGATNIIPYIGPIFGAIPGMLVAMVDPNYHALFWPILLVYGVANVIDMVLIFPVLVAKLVNLHPLVLIIAVMIGQEYYGLIGMLISIPVATAIKVILQEIYDSVYDSGASQRTSTPI